MHLNKQSLLLTQQLLLRLAFHDAVIQYMIYSPFIFSRTHVSFSIESDSLSFEEVQQPIAERMETLAELSFEILELSLGNYSIIAMLQA